ncbi:hypothetical protein GIB67_005097, partial [Kingdonia uniflora]
KTTSSLLYYFYSSKESQFFLLLSSCRWRNHPNLKPGFLYFSLQNFKYTYFWNFCCYFCLAEFFVVNR